MCVCVCVCVCVVAPVVCFYFEDEITNVYISTVYNMKNACCYCFGGEQENIYLGCQIIRHILYVIITRHN